MAGRLFDTGRNLAVDAIADQIALASLHTADPGSAGIVLVMAMLITPAATGFLLARRFVGVMVIGALIGVLSAAVGMYLSFHANMPTGPVMALVATAIFGLAAARGEWTKRSA